MGNGENPFPGFLSTVFLLYFRQALAEGGLVLPPKRIGKHRGIPSA